MVNRLFSLDYLRGLAALSIMIYHFVSWSFGHLDASSTLGRLGIYGVSIFYVLSGLTLYLVYSKARLDSAQLKDFLIKRVARIFPLFWLVTILVLLINRNPVSPWVLFLNFSGLFGFVDWDAGLATGIWSIGNELVFYAFFPLFIFLARKSKMGFILLTLGITLSFVLFAFKFLTPEKLLAEQWSTYVNPLNQVFLFFAGFLIGYFNGFVKGTYVNLTILIISIGLFMYHPYEGDHIGIVSGWNRIFFTFYSIAICMSFYNLNFHFSGFFGSGLAFLGESTYSVYLLHPIVWTIFASITKRISIYTTVPVSVQILLSVVATLILSGFIYNWFEKYFILKGKVFSKRLIERKVV